MSTIPDRQPVSIELLPGKSGRPLKYPSTVTTYAEESGLIGCGALKRQSKDDGVSLDDQIRDSDIRPDGAYVYREYAEPNTSGSKPDVYRPAYERAVADLEARTINGLCCGDIDRVTRLDLVINLLCEVYRRNEVAWLKGRETQLYWWCDDPDIDLRTGDGRNAALDAIRAANREAAKMAKRQRRRHVRERREGTMVGRRGYGHNMDGTLVETEATIIRQLADVADKRQKMQPVLDKLAKPLSRHRVQDMLTSARVAGLRSDKSNKTGPWWGCAVAANGEPIKGNQTPILELGQWKRIRRVYAERERGSERRTYLATGSFRCRGCDINFTGSPDKRRPDAYYYKCNGCGAYLHGPKTDDYLRLIVDVELARGTPATVEPKPWPRQGELDATNAMRAEKKAELQKSSPEKWLLLAEDYAETISSLERDRRQWLKDHPVPTGPADADLIERWESGDTTLERSVIRDRIQMVYVEAGSGWSADRFTPIPRNL